MISRVPFDYLPYVNAALGFVAVGMSLSDPIIASYIILACSAISALSLAFRGKMSDLGKKNDSLATLTVFGAAVGLLAYGQMDSINELMILLPTFFFLSTCIYVAKHFHTSIVHTLPPFVSGIVLPTMVILDVANPLMVSGWLMIAGTMMFFRFGKQEKGFPSMPKKEVDLEKVPFFEVDG